MILDCPPTVLEPGQVLEIPIKFAPRETKEYAFVIPFTINGSTKLHVNIVGLGIIPKLDLVDASQRKLNFGTVNILSEMRKTVNLINRSKKPIKAEFLDTEDSFKNYYLSYTPTGIITIAPKETVPLQLVFHPIKRTLPFTQDLSINFAGITKKLLTITGKAQGVEVKMDTDYISFGKVVLNSRSIKKFQLDNSGDVPVTFQWIESTFGSHFTISPTKGKVNVGTNIFFDVIFKPQSIDSDIQQDMTINVENVGLMHLTCSGACYQQTLENVQVLNFKSAVRKPEIKSVKVTNSTDKDWYLSPSLRSEHWSVPDEFKVPAKSSNDLLITFCPLAMTIPAPSSTAGTATTHTTGSTVHSDNSTAPKPHRGELFIPLPDGSALSYELNGESQQPECEGNIDISGIARKPTAFTLPLKNWLSKSQKFIITHEITEKSSPATFLIIANAVELTPTETKKFPIRYVFVCMYIYICCMCVYGEYIYNIKLIFAHCYCYYYYSIIG